MLRDAGELSGDYDDYLAVIQQPEKKQAKGNPGKFGMAVAGVMGLAIGLSMWLVPSGSVPTPSAQLKYSLSSNPVSQRVLSLFPDTPKINLRQDFRMGLGEWLQASSSTSDYVPGALRADNLKLWKPSLKLSDYQMEFQAAIEKKAVGWAFRAPDLRNYYASKITLGGRDGTRAELERIVTIAGHEAERIRLPIPVSIRPDTLYRVKLRVKGDQFSTSVDGQIVDMWRDKRLRQGGVGFFAERGEVASVRWVSLSEPDSFISRMFAFGFIVHPLAAGAGPVVGPVALNPEF